MRISPATHLEDRALTHQTENAGHRAGPGTAIFTGDGWLPSRGRAPLALTKPSRVMVATQAGEVPTLLDQVEDEQRRGNYVAGYLAYEAGAAFGLAVNPTSTTVGPLAWMAVYPPENATMTVSELSSARSVMRPQGFALGRPKEEYLSAVRRIRELIASGDTYQVNYTVRASFTLDADPYEYFSARAEAHPVPYSAFMDLDDLQIASLSPELFLRRDGDLLESRPMKGTRPRSDDPVEDARLARELFESEKDRSENLMIVDMARNDLGRVCKTGSVAVPDLFSVEPYATVWQMTSTVTGVAKPSVRLLDIISATFPGASVTGAPKHHTTEIIAGLEKEPRGIYTGLMGLFLPGGDFVCNLPIRTIVHSHADWSLGLGSGIVWDSDPEDEYRETLSKAAFISAGTHVVPEETPPAAGQFGDAATRQGADKGGGIFETILLEADGNYLWSQEHLDRMSSSARALGLPFDRARAEKMLAELAKSREAGGLGEGADSGERPAVGLAVRLDLRPSGDLLLASRPAPEAPPEAVNVLVSPIRIDQADPLLQHKTAYRPLYDQERAAASQQGFFEVIFVNRWDHVTEGSITNIFARFGEVWVTPPVSDGLLPGIWRAQFLAQTHAVERSLTLSELQGADEVVIGNSVRGTIPVAGFTSPR